MILGEADQKTKKQVLLPLQIEERDGLALFDAWKFSVYIFERDPQMDAIQAADLAYCASLESIPYATM